MSKGGKLRSLLERGLRSELLRYLFFGVLTTLVNLLCFNLLVQLFGLERRHLLNVLAIVLSILFAYYVNRRFVFASSNPVWRELLRFFGSRAFVSLVFDVGGFYLLYDLLGLRRSDSIFGMIFVWAKLATQLLVVVGNYIVGKFYVFYRKGEERPSL